MLDAYYHDLYNSGTNTSSTAPTNTTAPGGSLFGAVAPTQQQQPPQSGTLFSNLGTQNQQQQTPAGGNLFGMSSQQTQPRSSNLFGGLGSGSTQQPSGGSLFGAGTQQQQQQQQQQPQPQQTGSMFGASQQKPAGGSLFGAAPSTSQPQASGLLFGGLGQATGTTSTAGGGLFGASQPQPQQQQQQQQQPPQGPSLSLFGNRNTITQAEQRPATSTVQGVKIDVSNLVPTTKFESCTDDLKKEIEAIDTFILNQIRMCNEVSDILPTISSQGALVPNDVEFVQGKLDTLQEALENDARGIENARNQVARDAGEAKLAFRALDTLLLPLQYQPTAADRWLPPNQQSQSLPGRSLRSGLSARHMLALPEDAEADSSLEATGGPTNLVDYFSQRAEDMNGVVQRYRRNLKEIEDHLRGVEASLTQQISDLSSRSRDGGPPSHVQPTSRASELAATLGDVETAILGVAGRVGGVREEVQELVLGPLGMRVNGMTNGW
ncbi:hypothetical protein AJ78_03619 [Emergomyces pasteurianus Ep9510]|uniref:Nucleoporin NUP49/NSP49 n=1 Tax=Emergomyces pasteurianus Ep9510 TaxID=1447872 RepID=A0A1J9Q7G8_9EURO|nr:hypothetical protein AJ78_03619 [Emergomyces pasteurianus Ep9510]